MELFIHFLSFLLGLALVLATLRSAIRTFVLPRSANDPLTYVVFVTIWQLFRVRMLPARTFAEREKIAAWYAPVGLLSLPPTWLILVFVGYAGMFWALGISSGYEALRVSGSSLLTLGFANASDLPKTLLMFSEAALGLILVALLIAYLPTMYSAFSRRETAVTLLEVRAGSPPSAIELIARYHRLKRFDELHTLWEQWEVWFAEIEETHTSLAALVFFRSPQPDHSWVTASGAILDSAALVNAVLDIPHDVQADLCIRSGYLALRRIADFFNIKYNSSPGPTEPISISRDEFDRACDQLVQRGVPLKLDRHQAWRDFSGWRVNYDTVLLSLAGLVGAPEAMWSSDRVHLAERSWLRRGLR
jgi:hypothetical protein